MTDSLEDAGSATTHGRLASELVGVRRRLAVLVPNMGGGGAERVVVNLLKGFVGAGLEVDLLLVSASGPLMKEVPPEVRVIQLRGGRIIASLPSLVLYFHRYRPDAVLSHLDTMNVVALVARWVARLRSRIVLTTHIALSEQMRDATLRQRFVAWLVSKLYPGADVVVGVSRGVVADLENRIGRNRVEVRAVYNPIVTEALLRRARPRATLERASFPPTIPGGRRIILTAGRLTVQKNHGLLLEAFALLASEFPDTHLVILGEGPLRSRLSAQITRLGLTDRVTLPGFIPEPSDYFHAASVFVLSSRWEGLPTVLIEALVFGCPIVSTRCPSGPEEILEDGKYGRLVPMNDPDAMARAIRDTLVDQPDPQVLRERALDFGLEQSVRAYLALLFPGESER